MSRRAEALHATPWKGVFHVTGGGTRLLSEMLTTPGASATVLEATVPYAFSALSDLLGRAPEQACAEATARAMAMAAYERALGLRATDDHAPLFGLGCTASLGTNRTKRGAHRAHWAIQTAATTVSFTAFYEGDRASEEAELLTQLWASLRYVLMGARRASSLGSVNIVREQAPEAWQALLQPTPARWCNTQHDGALLLPGSFNPIHDGHREMLAIAEHQLGRTGAYEIAVQNADKPNLDFVTVAERLQGIGPAPVWLTNAPTFAEKAALFPNATFALGVDTMQRIGELRFYGNDVARRDAAFEELLAHGASFLVFGRVDGERFATLADLDLPAQLAARCTEVPESAYRRDISSTALRAAREAGG